MRHRLVKLRMKLLEKISLFVFRFFVKRVENYRFAVFFYGLSGHYALRKMFEFLGYEEVKIHDGEFSKCYYNALRKLIGEGGVFFKLSFLR
ncbi:hypothetical protein R0U46_001695 [Campylobacter upsaliensis]|nr:hypothetical protein [Campylobacter upsaliensis]